jgi:hypothetical protein
LLANLQAAQTAGLVPKNLLPDIEDLYGIALTIRFINAGPASLHHPRHHSATVAAGYVRDADPFRGSAEALVGLSNTPGAAHSVHPPRAGNLS